MSVDTLRTSWDQCRSMVQYSFTSTETRRLVRTDSPGRPPRLSHSSWTRTVYSYISYITLCGLFGRHSSGAVWESRWPSWAVRPNEPSGFRGRKELLNRASALVTTCPKYVNWHLRTLSINSSSSLWTLRPTFRSVPMLCVNGPCPTCATSLKCCSVEGLKEKLYLTLHCFLKERFCVKMGSDESCFNDSFSLWGTKSHDTLCSANAKYWFTTSFLLGGGRVPESEAWSVTPCSRTTIFRRQKRDEAWNWSKVVRLPA